MAGLFTTVGRGRVRRARAAVEGLEGTRRTWANTALIVGCGAVLVVVPLLVGKLTNELLANVGLFVLLALGLNVVVGLAGILDLGYVAFFAVGGYSAAVLTSATAPRISPELPWLVALVPVVVITGLVGLFIGAPVIRMRGDYLAIVTLGFGEIIRILFLSDWLSGVVRRGAGNHQRWWRGGVRPGERGGHRPSCGVLPGAGVLRHRDLHLVAPGAFPAGPGLDGGARRRNRGRGHGREHGEREVVGVRGGGGDRILQRWRSSRRRLDRCSRRAS